MASAYALPLDNANRHAHSHSQSHLASRSISQFPPSNSSDATNSTFSPPRANGSLFTHQEASRESSPNQHHQHHQSVHSHDRHIQDPHISREPQTAPTFPRGPQHNHTHTSSQSAIRSTYNMMKGRARGESDLGRPTASAHMSAAQRAPATSNAWLTAPEALTAFLIPLPYLLASAAYASTHGHGTEIQLYPLPAYAPRQLDAGSHSSVMLPGPKVTHGPSLLEASALTSGTLLLVAALSKSVSAGRTLDRRKDSSTFPQRVKALMTVSFPQTVAIRALSLGLPFYAAMQLGGLRVGLVLLTSTAANLTCADMPLGKVSNDLKKKLASRGISVAIFVISMVLDLSGWTFHASYTDVAMGYLALACSIILLHPPLPTVATAATSRTTSRPVNALAVTSPWNSSATSPLVSSIRDQDTTLLAGVVMSLVTLGMSMLWSSTIFELGPAMALSIMAVLTMSGAVLFSAPSSIRSEHKTGMAMACLFSASIAFLFSPELWPGTIINGGLSALSFIGVLYDTNGVEVPRSHDERAHEHSLGHHTHNDHHHQHEHGESCSAFTKFMIGRFRPGSLAHGILSEKDSRRIAYFTTLNFAFMFVQGAYGYLSGSLGLLSDTVHMFFDCLGLVVGLAAAVASKWPTSPDKPYGWGKLNTLAGFGNGVFLMLVSLEFVWEAIEGILERHELRHVKELMVVTVLGFIVNMIGLFAFGHAHAGHDHGHDHGHSHSHSQSHSHSHNHSHPHAHDHAHDHAHAHGLSNGNVHGHDHDHQPSAPIHAGHDHHNENMHGLFLHVAADAGGSLAVITSTALTLWKPWYLWDPLATIIIAILIFAMAIPLVKSSGQKLLLVVPDDLEYLIKNALQELSELRGVVGYAVPRFWIDDKEDATAAGHDHDHDHDHDRHHHAHDQHDHAHAAQEPKKERPGKKVKGIIHIIAAPAADLEDVRARVDDFVHARGMDLVVQVEHEADGRCWCRGVPM